MPHVKFSQTFNQQILTSNFFRDQRSTTTELHRQASVLCDLCTTFYSTAMAHFLSEHYNASGNMP